MIWSTKKLGEICRIKTGEKDVDEGNPQGPYPFFSCSRKITYSNTYSFDTEAILIAGNGDVGNTKIYKGKFEAYQRTYVLDGFNDNIKYIYYYLIGNLKQILVKSKSGSTMPYIRKGDLENLQIPLPPLPIQQKIVKILDTIQEAIEIQEKIIEKTKELKKALMNLLFHYGLAGLRVKELMSSRVGELKSEEIEKLGIRLKKTEIGEIPEDWEVVRLGEVCEKRNEQFLPKSNDIYVGLEHIDSGSIKLNRYGYGNNVKSLTNKFYPKDILYGKLRPYLDKGVIVENEGACSTDLIVIRCNKEKISPFYLINLIHTSRFLNFATETITGTNHPRTSWASLKTLLIPLSPLPEQQEIAEILQTIDQKIEIEQRKKALYEELFKTMLNKIMNQKVDVEAIGI